MMLKELRQRLVGLPVTLGESDGKVVERISRREVLDWVDSAILAQRINGEPERQFAQLIGQFHHEVWHAALEGGVDYDVAGEALLEQLVDLFAAHRAPDKPGTLA